MKRYYEFVSSSSLAYPIIPKTLSLRVMGGHESFWKSYEAMWHQGQEYENFLELQAELGEMYLKIMESVPCFCRRYRYYVHSQFVKN